MFWENFNRMCISRGLTPNAAARQIGIPSGSVTDWKRGRIPRDATVIRIADFFGVTASDLMSDTTTDAVSQEVPSPSASILQAFSRPDTTLTDAELDLICDYRSDPAFRVAVDAIHAALHPKKDASSS